MVPRRSAALASAASLLPLVLAACGEQVPLPDLPDVGMLSLCGEVPTCDPTVTVAADSPALLVTDKEALAALPLEDVLTRLIQRNDGAQFTPRLLVRKLFDTNNDSATGLFEDIPHCDSPHNLAHQHAPAAQCPRKEGTLADSPGYFEPGHPDHFIPVAAVNRFDLASMSGRSCGEYRLIYAKESGLTDPHNRLFMILEATLPSPSPGCLIGCRPVVEYWKSLESEKDPAVIGQKLRTFFLEGIGQFVAPIDPDNLGFNTTGGYNGGVTGQVRISQHVGDEWEWRQFAAGQDGRFAFVPVLAGNNPVPSYFEPGLEGDSSSAYRKKFFAEDFVYTSVARLGTSRVEDMSANISIDYLSGESALGGDAINDYVARAQGNVALFEMIEQQLKASDLGADCPADDPLDGPAIVRRATVQSCAGCHAPSRFLGPDRKLGCGLTFPDSLGEVQIDEQGNRSPALRDVFLPHRASVMATYLQACSEEAIRSSFNGTPQSGMSLFAGRSRTLGGSVTH